MRYLTNASSGKMGYAMAKIAVLLGAEVTLIFWPTHLIQLPVVKLITATSAAEIHEATMLIAKQHDIFIATAAVTDYRPAHYSPQKIKKAGEQYQLNFSENTR